CQNGFTKDELHQMASAEDNTSGPVVNDKWRMLKITLQAPFLNVHNDVCSHQFRPRSSSNDF
ncbi:hypothetical protein Tco_0549912, partial [Tanacetum coccineum]